jgi:hypothetical protein
MKIIALLCLLSASVLGQSPSTSTAESKGACSPANTGNKNTFNIKCGIGKEQGDQILKLLNKILADHIDFNALMAAVEHIESEVNNTGVLEPDTRPDPQFPTKPDPSFLNVLLGNNLASMSGKTCSVLNLNGTDVLWVEKSKNGLSINAKVFSPTSKIMALIEKNAVTLNPHNTFKRDIRKHTLKVMDESLQEVLNVDFVNARSVIITGIFYQEGYGKIVVDLEKMLDMSANTYSGDSVHNCDDGFGAFRFSPQGIVIGYHHPSTHN